MPTKSSLTWATHTYSIKEVNTSSGRVYRVETMNGAGQVVRSSYPTPKEAKEAQLKAYARRKQLFPITQPTNKPESTDA